MDGGKWPRHPSASSLQARGFRHQQGRTGEHVQVLCGCIFEGLAITQAVILGIKPGTTAVVMQRRALYSRTCSPARTHTEVVTLGFIPRVHGAKRAVLADE